MKFPKFFLIGLISIPSLASSEPAAECRAKFANDSNGHIACLESAIQELQAADVGDSAALPEPAKVPEPVTEPVTVAAIASGSTQSSTPDASTIPPSGLGSEQVRENSPQANADDEQVTVQIVATTYNSKGLGTFRMDDGQVWRETSASPERKRLDTDEHYTARIERSKIGGYRMYVDGVRWMKTVERLE